MQDGQTFRGNCPFCGGRNTFTLSRKGSDRIWHCYRASCGVAGFTGNGDSLAGIKRTLDKTDINPPDFIAIPPLFPIEGRHSVIKWLDRVHALQAYREALIDLKYAPSEDRIMFAVNGGTGWTGRARMGIKPKWRKYGDTSSLLTVGTGSTAVVVEDAPSACAVGIIEGYTGTALLGTSLTLQHRLELARYEHCIVCLDPDAAMKALEMVKILQGVVDTTMRIIPDDLKNITTDEVMEVLNA